MFEQYSPKAKLSDLWGLLVIFTLILWFCQDLVLSEKVPFFRDLSTYFYPLRFSLYESFSTGELPLWNRHMAMGFPQLADFQSGVFYPPHLFLAVLPFFTAIRFLFVFHFLIAGVGAFCLFRSWQYPRCLSIVGALLYTLGGTLVSLTNLLNHFQSAVWLPWVILFWERVLRSTSWENFLALTLLTATQFLAGSPELFVMSMALVILDGFRVKRSARELSYGKLISIFLALGFVVIALVMVQLLPTTELFAESRRQQSILFREATLWSLNPFNLINLFFLDKEVDPTVPVGAYLFFNHDTAFLVTYYLSALSIIGICLWFCLVSLAERAVLLGLIVLSLLVAFGHYTPFYKILFEHVPFFASLRFPEKFFFLTYALLIFVIMRGLHAYLRADDTTTTPPLFVIGSVCLSLLGVYVFGRLNTNIVSRLTAAASGLSLLSGITAKSTASVFVNLERQVALSFGLVFLLFLAQRKLLRSPVFGVLLVAIVFVDLACAHRSFLYVLDSGFVHDGSRVIKEPNPNLSRLFYYPAERNLHPSYVSVLGRPAFRDATALAFRTLLPNAGVLYGFDYMQEIDAFSRRPYTEFLDFGNQLDPARQIKLLRCFNVEYLLAFRSLSIKGITLVRQFPEYFSWLYRVEQPLPRTYMVNNSTVEKGSQKILRRLSSAEFDPANEVVLDQGISIRPKRALES